ncbi:unnamed protein product [Thlaspi arvense]|uniref:Exonuclease domain-containing protein n=1 Tax=Thlaspi arvense TaxID=13288 RepID=A0AAU9S189_THLAR|nr:unnamed protein product [Thlaspi arvense]
MSEMMSDPVIAFFDFKRDTSGILRLGVIAICSETLERIDESVSTIRDETQDWLELEGVPTFLEISDWVYHMLDGRIWMGHDIKPDVDRLKKAFEEIGREPSPSNEGSGIDYCTQNLNAIEQSGEVMSLLDPDNEKNNGDDMHPMISQFKKWERFEAAATSESLSP